MVLRDIADAVEMHESTISRVTTGSLIQTPQGTLELKSFFSVGLQQDNEAGLTSSASIKYKIKKLIEAENPSFQLVMTPLLKYFLAKGSIWHEEQLQNIAKWKIYLHHSHENEEM